MFCAKANVIIDECFENTKSNCEYYDHIQGPIYKEPCLTDTRLNCKEVAEARVIECRKYTMCYCASYPEHCALHRDFGGMLLGK